jgi:hypothetical protein
MATVKTKFRVVSVYKDESGNRNINLAPVVTAEENEVLWKTNPNGNITLNCNNPDSKEPDMFDVKKEVTVTFETAD